MRRILFTFALLAMAAPAALATDLSQPVRVRLSGEPHAAEAGKPFEMKFDLISAKAAEMTNLRLEGDGWEARLIDTPAAAALAARERFTVRFEATCSDPNQPLVLRFELDEKPFEQVLELSQPALESAYRHEEAALVRGTEDLPFPGVDLSRPPAEPSAREPGEVYGKPDRVMADDPRPDNFAARTIRVHGRFVYYREDGVMVGADGLMCRVYDEDTGPDEELDHGTTDANGYFDISFTWDPCWVCDATPDLYVEFETDNAHVEVERDTWQSNNYFWDTGTWDDYGGGDLNVGTRYSSQVSYHPALHVLTVLTRGRRWFNDPSQNGYNVAKVYGRWPFLGATNNSSYSDDEIFVADNQQWDDDTMIHEYGHHWVHHYGAANGSDYCNGVCDPPQGCRHCDWCSETAGDAWNEGFSDWVADVVTRAFDGLYTTPPMLHHRSGESIGECIQSSFSSTNPDSGDICVCNPLSTEGFLTALLRDVEDSTNEDDPRGGGTWRDRIGWGPTIILSLADQDPEPDTPQEFLNALVAWTRTDNPSQVANLWETAKNAGYDIDTQAPGVATNLDSPSHNINDSASPDNSIEYTWTRATDDASGVAGYSIVVDELGSTLPDNQVTEVNDVTSYTASGLPPTTAGRQGYWIHLRTKDRSGRWSANAAHFGPIDIRQREPINLVFYDRPDWAGGAFVVRNDNDALISYVPAPTTLDGNTTNTYWNVSGRNTGDSPTCCPMQTWLLVDDQFRNWSPWNGPVGTLGVFYHLNAGPVNIRGGRHTCEAILEATEDVLESDEDDNFRGRQWIWTPYNLAPEVRIARASPPINNAGWSSSPGPNYYNCDGLHFATDSWWNAVWVHASDAATDVDCRLHAPSTGATNGFTSTAYGYSRRPAGALDAVIVNKNVAGNGSYDVGVLNANGGSNNYYAKYVTSTTIPFDNRLDLTLGADEMLALFEIDIGPGDLGAVSVTVDIDAAQGPLHLVWLDDSFARGDLSDGTAEAVTNPSGHGRLDVMAPDGRFHCLVVYRDPEDEAAAPIAQSMPSIPMTVEVQRTPPDFEPYLAAGWDSPFVPRPAFDGTPASVPAPTALIGNVPSTYYNYATLNNSPTPQAAGMVTRGYLDGISYGGVSWGSFAANGSRLFNSSVARTVRGGRHTIAVHHDGDALIEEIQEDDNIYGDQWVWTPLPLALGTPVSRPAPPDLTGGWADVNSGWSRWYNCDGLRTPVFANSGPDGLWGAVAALPGASSDVDLELHELSTGPKDGFAVGSVASAWGVGQSDYVLVNFRRTPFRAFDVGVLLGGGGEGYTAEVTTSIFRNATGVLGPFTLDANRIVDLHEFRLAAGNWDIYLENVSGSLDWGLTLHADTLEYSSKSDALSDGVAWLGGPGQGERATVAVPRDTLYCLAVWKARAADLGNSGTYQLHIYPQTVDVPGAPARSGVTALASVHPNPFRHGTAVAFELASERQVEMEVFDLRGGRVKTLASGRWQPGRHQVAWDGRDDAGRRVANGIYLVRMRAENYAGTRKLVMLE